MSDAPPDPVGAAEREVGQFIYRRIEVLMDAKAGTPDGFELSYLAQIVADVEEYDADGSEPREPFAVNLGDARPVEHPDEREEIARIISPSAFARKRRGRLQDDINPADREHNRNRALAKADAIILAATAHLSAEREEHITRLQQELSKIRHDRDKAFSESAALKAEREELREALRGGEGMKDGVGKLSLDQLIGWVETEYRKVRVMSDPRPLHLAAISEYLRRARKLVGGQ